MLRAAPTLGTPGKTPTAQAEVLRVWRGFALLRAVLVLAIFAVAAVQIASRRADDLAEATRRADNLAQVMAEQTSRSLQAIDVTLREIQGRLTTAMVERPADADAGRSRSLYDLFIERGKGLPQVDAFMVVGADGRMLNTSREFPAVPVDVTKRDYFQYLSANDDHTLFVSVPVTTYLTGRRTVFLSRRLNDLHGQFAGAVVAAVTLSHLEDLYRAVAPPGAAITLLRRNGVVLARYPSLDAEIGAKLPADSDWYRLVAADGGSFSSVRPLNDVDQLVSVRPLREFPLVVDVSIMRQEALSGWWRQVRWLLAAACFASACAVLLVWACARQFMRLAGQNALLEHGRHQLDAVLSNMSQGLTLFDANEKLIVYNRRYAEIYKLPLDKLRPGVSLADIVRCKANSASLPPMTQDEYLARRRAFTAAEKSFDITDEFPDGRVVSMHYRPLAGGGWVVTHEEITERRRNETALVFMARHDSLTRLPNRVLFLERMADAIALTKRGGHCALLCLDLDRFKTINDTLGHPVGDGLLRAVAARLTGIVRAGDTVARLGGDEFAIVLGSLKSPRHAASLADRIIAAFAEPYDIDGHRIIAATSIGISVAPKDGDAPDTLMKNADIALYLAKAEGRGTYRFFEPEVDSQIQRRRAVEHDLRAALPAEDFVLHYQPVIDLATGAVAGFEALIRWRHPTRGLLEPSVFLSVAEETGLIVGIGEWVLRRACQAALDWPDAVAVSVNVSPVQFRRGQIVDAVRAVLAVSGLPAHRLELEVTEATLLEHTEERLASLRLLQDLGVRIALDNFGTGYSSISHLRAFPFARIKIDGSLVGQSDSSSGTAAVIGAIVGLAQSLGMSTTAEGVENVQQLETLRERGCACAQGYLFSRPLPVGDAIGLIGAIRIPGTGAPARAIDQAAEQRLLPAV